MALMAGSGIDHVAYILILYSLASLLFLFVMVLIHVYDRGANRAEKPIALSDGHASLRRGEETQLRDANEFELEGLVSDDEDEERAARRKLLARERVVDGDDGLGSPSTVGRNDERVA